MATLALLVATHSPSHTHRPNRPATPIAKPIDARQRVRRARSAQPQIPKFPKSCTAYSQSGATMASPRSEAKQLDKLHHGRASTRQR